MISTADFLKHILPGDGHYAAFVQETKRHIWSGEIDQLAAAILAADAAGRTVYHACGSFNEATRRTAKNALGARAFWLDVDAGEGKPYVDAAAAALAVAQFAQKLGLPVPLYVGSGNGVHAYWPLVETLDPETWRRYALGLKQACVRENLYAGPERTADIASILRPPGTHWRKAGVKEVIAGPLAGPYPIEAFERLLDGQPVRSKTIRTDVPRLAAALGDVHENEPRYSEPIANACAQLGALRSTRGKLPEPFWYASLGVLTWCEDGEQFGQEWSSGYDGYTVEETAARLQRSLQLSGATTCEHFHSLNPKTCEACPHWGKIKSPISLGRRDREPTVETNVFGEPLKKEPPPIDGLPELPHDFFWRNDGALVTRQGSQRGDVDIVVSRHPLYLDSVQTGEVRGEYNLVLKQYLPGRAWSDISLASRTVFGSASGAELASSGANIHEHTHFIHYLRGAIDLLRAKNKLTMRYDQFGWKDADSAFLYGLDLYAADGPHKITGNDELQARCSQEWVGPAKEGSLEGWKQAINALFAQGCEPQSVALLAAFAAPLMRFQERDEGGAIIHLVTRESGTGKSTALIGAASVWGRREGLGLTNDDTRVSKALTLGALGNLPVIFDEITIRDPEAIRAFVINFTNGRDKMRATRMGEIRHTASTWQTILISASNTSLVDALSTQNHPEAPAMRIMEFGLSLPEELKHAQGDKLRKALRTNSGHAGRIFIEWLVKPVNLARTKAMLESVTQQTWARTGFRSEHRFWVRTIAAIAVAGVIVRQLGLVEFSVDRIMSWLFDALGVGEASERRDWAVPALTEFLNASIDEALVMPGPWLAGTKQHPIRLPRNRLAIRYEIASNRCLIACSSLREWLVGRELSYQAMVKELERIGVITRKRLQATLSAGSDIPGGQVWCVEINTSHEAVAGAAQVIKENVVPISAAQHAG